MRMKLPWVLLQGGNSGSDSLVNLFRFHWGLFMMSNRMIARCKFGRPMSLAQKPKDGESTQHNSKHVVRPTKDIVVEYLANPTDEAWEKFESAYVAILQQRFQENRKPFDELADRARNGKVLLLCDCPTKHNPAPNHCHTIPALQFMKARYPDLKVDLSWPSPDPLP